MPLVMRSWSLASVPAVQHTRQALLEVCKRASIPYRWHDLRHSFVTRLAERPRVSEQTMRALAGHVSNQPLQHYSHIRSQAKQIATVALEEKAIEPFCRSIGKEMAKGAAR